MVTHVIARWCAAGASLILPSVPVLPRPRIFF